MRVYLKSYSSAKCLTGSEEFSSQYFYLSDHLGSAQLVTNQDGEVYQRIEYTPYGETWIDMRTNITALYDVPYRFTAKELDKETGLYYYGARYLDPKYSRWISTDPALGEYMSGSKAGMCRAYNAINLSLYNYGNNNPIRYIDPDGRAVDEEGHSTNKFKFFQCFENMFNGFGFRSSEKIKEYNNSNIGKFARKGIGELKTTDWAKTKTGQNVIKGLEDAYKKGRIHEKEGNGGLQLGWGCFAHMFISKGAIERYTSGRGKDALAILAHEGSHYTYATRHGFFSFWWHQYEVEGYRISDIVSLELTGRNWVNGPNVRSVEKIEEFLATTSPYKWLPKFPFSFNYWNKKDIGR